MSSQHSESRGFTLLHPSIQRWIWKQGWTSLRDIQEQAIGSILDCNRDVIISASTAGGKTEAAFLPAISDVLRAEPEGVGILGIIPLKALINDQFQRMEGVTRNTDVPVFAWHGDISTSRKGKALSTPSSILLITPESLEALFVRRHAELRKAFRSLRRIVVDELHAFIGTERGMQLQSLMHRVEMAAGRKIPRIGLSATLGDMSMASDFLRHDGSLPCDIIESKTGGRELKVQVRGYVETKSNGPDHNEQSVWQAIGSHLFTTLRGSNNLAFANSRQNVELLSDMLRRTSEATRVPNEFFPHHGSLSKEIREETEERLKKHSLPTSVVCTNTLELGIDIGSVKSVAQIGPPPSVASLCQRIGRSGRKEGDPAILRAYVREAEWDAELPLFHKLRLRTVQVVAMIQLLAQGWNEPPLPNRLHLSTFIQQLLSSISQHGGMNPAAAWSALCGTGPFAHIDTDVFKHLLTVLGAKDILLQAGDGTLLLGEKGERIVEHYTFYAAFTSPEEVSIVTEGKTLGTLTTVYPIVPDSFLIFAGRRWIIKSYDEERKQVLVSPATGGELPKFDGSGGSFVHDRVREEMRNCLETTALPPFLDKQGQELLAQARKTYAEVGLKHKGVLTKGTDTTFVVWKGDRICFTIFLMLLKSRLSVDYVGPVFTAHKVSPADFNEAIGTILKSPPPDPMVLIHTLKGKEKEKFDYLLDDGLLDAACSVGILDVEGAINALSHLRD
ncbi:DEAD/DEAH box helicase [Pseudodesulfovibrio portus]|uniref:DEAD/DEAH box helicase n=1 Tax=Pseudodesulfovibrio portus TaxID=231439 RepID=UPI002231A266|nr:DEAD/DEAH box helicase [Pseudodesulfovibrio portus]